MAAFLQYLRVKPLRYYQKAAHIAISSQCEDKLAITNALNSHDKLVRVFCLGTDELEQRHLPEIRRYLTKRFVLAHYGLREHLYSQATTTVIFFSSGYY
jgi:hypothetical protein